MIELTEQQRRELRQADEVRVSDPDTQRQYVIVRAEIYDRLKTLCFDDGDWTPEEQALLLAESGEQAGWNDPAMDVYDQYDEHHRQRSP